MFEPKDARKEVRQMEPGAQARDENELELRRQVEFLPEGSICHCPLIPARDEEP